MTAAPISLVHLVDGTYELFRHYYAVPSRLDPTGQEIGATRGVVDNILRLLESGATHVGVATDHVIDSFRNTLYGGYKRDGGIEAPLRTQFTLVEAALHELGVTVWPMVDYEADDALAAAARVAVERGVRKVAILTPDKDLAQCVTDPTVVQIDRRRETIADEAAVQAKFGVPPRLIPDYLALVGDQADGFPGIPGFGPKSAATVLTHFGGLDAIPTDPDDWGVPGLRGAAKLAATLAERREDAELFRRLATLVTDGPQVGTPDEWRWTGPRAAFADWALRLDSPGWLERVTRLADERA
jgi:5'-3' exonuclease